MIRTEPIPTGPPALVVVVVCSLLLLSARPSSPASAPVATNMDLIVATVEDAADKALAGLDDGEMLSREQGAILIVSQSEHDANWLVEHVLIDRMLQRGFEVRVAADSAEVPNGISRLAYRVLDLGIRSTSGLRGANFKRQSHTTVALQLSQTGEETVDWQDETTVFREDSAPKSMLELLQSSTYDFAKTELEEETWSKFAEPVIVTTVLGGLIYLFFSNR
jgi:hypothetical protein